MAFKNFDTVIYKLTAEDLQIVADDVLDRELTKEEIKLLEEKIGDYINWYDAIEFAINYNNIKK
jgi:hypothetical protein